MMRRGRRRFLVVATLAVMTLGVPAASAAPAEDGTMDISASPAGRARASEVAARFRSYNIDVDARDLLVRQLADGSMVIADPSVDLGDHWSTPDGQAGGRVAVRPESASRGEPMIASLGDQVILADAGWALMSSNCFARYNKTDGWMDTCWEIQKSTAEQDPSYEYWAIKEWATVDATTYRTYTDYAWLHVDRDGGPTFYWYDWSPGSTNTQNCVSTPLGITVAGFGFSSAFIWCETWTVTKYAAAGEIKVQYQGNSADARSVALFSGIKIVQGSGSPVWGVSYDFMTGHL